jgi:hypothetical protein
MPKHTRSTQHDRASEAPEQAALDEDFADAVDKGVGGLDKEDILILVLSAILVIATIWIGRTVL